MEILEVEDAGRGLDKHYIPTRYPNGFDERGVEPGITGDKIVRTWVMHSDDHGATWRSIVGNLPDETINVVVEDPLDERILYVGTDMGVWVTGDGGARRHALAPGLPTTLVHDLEVQPDARELVIGTHGRSIFVLPLTEVRETLGAGRF